MVSLWYVGAVSLLFLPWAYGLYALVRDARNRWLPLARQYVRGRREQKKQKEREEEREERRKQLY
ncbi:MAG: hypothetical protein ABEH80_03930 [Halobaculum sp.]|jgi:hypothetical protein